MRLARETAPHWRNDLSGRRSDVSGTGRRHPARSLSASLGARHPPSAGSAGVRPATTASGASSGRTARLALAADSDLAERVGDRIAAVAAERLARDLDPGRRLPALLFRQVQ
jgi:hypothetical protein